MSDKQKLYWYSQDLQDELFNLDVKINRATNAGRKCNVWKSRFNHVHSIYEGVMETLSIAETIGNIA